MTTLQEQPAVQRIQEAVERNSIIRRGTMVHDALWSPRGDLEYWVAEMWVKFAQAAHADKHDRAVYSRIRAAFTPDVLAYVATGVQS